MSESSLLAALTPILDSLPDADAPIFLAILERMAADKYRGWAEQCEDPIEKMGLLGCADREVAIAEFIEALDSDSGHRAEDLRQRFPQVQSLYDGVMAGQDRQEQFRRQAAGELGGADFLRQFRGAHSGVIAAQFEALALGEEANSLFLTMLADSM